jgi:hypothetical protein
MENDPQQPCIRLSREGKIQRVRDKTYNLTRFAQIPVRAARDETLLPRHDLKLYFRPTVTSVHVKMTDNYQR